MGDAIKIDIPILLFKGYRVMKAREKDSSSYSEYRNILAEETNGFGAPVDEKLFLGIHTECKDNPSKEFWLVWKGQELIGELYLRDLKEGEEAYISFIAVLKKYRNNGIGSVLLEAAGELSIKKKCRNITLAVEHDMPELVKWYGKHGYRETHRNPEMFHMLKPLESNTKFKWFRKKIF